MLDIAFIRKNPEKVAENAVRKGYDVNISALLEADTVKRQLQGEADALREKRNANASSLKGSRPSDELIAEGKQLKEQLSGLEEKLRAANETYLSLLKQVPNMATHDVPDGKSEDDNVVVKTVGETTSFDFEPKNHMEIADAKWWIDKERASKVAGARFAYIKGDLVRLQLAIMQFVIDTLGDSDVIKNIAERAGLQDVSTKPFTPVLPPYMIRTELYDAMDRLEPKDDRYKIEGEELWLQGSAEHVLGSMHADEVFEATDLPIRYLGFATSFRKEAGTYGKDMEGIIRMHQFDKLEMESFTDATNGLKEHLLFVAIQEYLLEQLALPYHVLQKCTADIGKPNARGIDMEVWFPSQNKYRETHTADYMTDYQARRLKTRVKGEQGLELIHTNDGTAFAMGRIMAAIIENYQTEDGNVQVPEVLRSYIGSRDVL